MGHTAPLDRLEWVRQVRIHQVPFFFSESGTEQVGEDREGYILHYLGKLINGAKHKKIW